MRIPRVEASEVGTAWMAALVALVATTIVSGCAEPSAGDPEDHAQRALSAPGVPEVQPPAALPASVRPPVGVVWARPAPDGEQKGLGGMLVAHPGRAPMANAPMAMVASGPGDVSGASPTVPPEENTGESAQ